MMRPEKFYEIELKSLLTKEKYDELADKLPKIMDLINEELITTTRYRINGGPEDIRLRISDKTIELISKRGEVTQLVREEIKIPLESKEVLEHFREILESVGFKNDPPWTKYKKEYVIKVNGFNYVVCLQDIKNFAYILEVEYTSEKDESLLHEENIKKIMDELGCEPINPESFSLRVKEYIKNKKVDY